MSDARPPSRFDGRRQPPEESLGPLEQRVLDGLWRRTSHVSVRELHAEFRGVAYTTLMTTLDRLYRKGLLTRLQEGRAFLYAPRYTREGLASERARLALERVLASGPSAWRPVLSTLIDAVTDRDEDALDELERLVRERRKGGRP